MIKPKFLKHTLVLFVLLWTALFFTTSIGQDLDKINKPWLIESYDKFKADEASMIIDLLKKQVDANEGSRGYIIVYCGKVCRRGEIEAHLNGIRIALQLKNLDAERYVAIAGPFHEITKTEFWFVPKDACPPTPKSTIDPKTASFKGRFGKDIVNYECCFD